jgi:hypothetical protein
MEKNRQGSEAMREYEAKNEAFRAQGGRLRALRLAKEAEEASQPPRPTKPAPRAVQVPVKAKKAKATS